MAIIDPEGLFEGERLGACSDIAQLYWPRLFLAANSCARMELSYHSIISKVFKTFRNPPSQEELWAIFEEFERNYLAILYEVHGVWWCQFITSEKYLPKYKKTRDEATPGPNGEMLRFHGEGYRNWKKQNSFKNQSFRKISNGQENFQRRGIGEVLELERSGEERKGEQAPTSPACLEEPIEPSMAVSAVIQKTGVHTMSGRIVLDRMAVEAEKRGEDLVSWAETLAKAWEYFVESRPKLSYAWSAEKFFGEGHYKNSDGWPWKQGQQPKKKLKAVSE